MSLVIRDTSSVPPDRWSYYVAATLHRIESPNWNALYDLVSRHCVVNGVPVPSLQDVVDQVCRELHVNCYDDQTRQPLVNKFSLGLPHKPSSCCSKTLK
jgi:hypothetical protein